MLVPAGHAPTRGAASRHAPNNTHTPRGIPGVLCLTTSRPKHFTFGRSRHRIGDPVGICPGRYRMRRMLRCSPRPSMATRISCPSPRYVFGFIPWPTPAGVPVEMTSPGFNCTNRDT